MTALPRDDPTDQYTVSVILWGGDQGTSDSNNHVALAVHRSAPQPVTWDLHHARCPDQVHFIYESRAGQRLEDADSPPRGRCDLRADLSAEGARAANAALARFGADDRQLPYFGEGNCHNWAAGAVAALEGVGLAAPGDGAHWAAMIGKGPVAMQRAWAEDAGRRWVPCERFSNQVKPDTVDARWGHAGSGEEQGVAIEGGSNSREFRNRVEDLKKLLGR